MEVTIGGNRVGSGKKMKGRINNYYRSTHNLSEKWLSSMASGVLYPCLCKLAMRGDAFDIEVNADARTIPAVSALFGSYKLQLDIYQCPIRLYQGILHNNPLAIGLKMNQVKFPKLVIESDYAANTKGEELKFNTSSLIKYLGMSGIGTPSSTESAGTITRKINAIPVLSYYDIFKTYYANKQEDKAYVISGEKQLANDVQLSSGGTYEGETLVDNWSGYGTTNFKSTSITDDWTKIYASYDYGQEAEYINPIIKLQNSYGQYIYTGTLEEMQNLSEGIQINTDYNTGEFEINRISTNIWRIRGQVVKEVLMEKEILIYKETLLKLQPFDLKNIDDMRYDLLCNNRLGDNFEIDESGDYDYMPYSAIVGKTSTGVSLNTMPMNGLVLKTYQNDIFNNWLNTEWIEGENSINELTKVTVVDGKFSMDALTFAMKRYNMLNRVAVSGGTYEDWQDTMYEEVKRKQIESPIFCGGIAQEIVFDEIIQTAPTDGSPLGTLGGRGRVVQESKKGGKIHIKCDEACFIIGIISLTPRQVYTQGNEFYLTDVETMDDLHKPGMDGIGFQDLIGERMAWFDTKITPNSATIANRSKIGKLPAWIEYMTSVDRAYGDFAELPTPESGRTGAGYMILNRNYEMTDDLKIKDATTYVDPAKYNYAFADARLEAQNFWVQCNFSIKARRLMSARIIPNV